MFNSNNNVVVLATGYRVIVEPCDNLLIDTLIEKIIVILNKKFAGRFHIGVRGWHGPIVIYFKRDVEWAEIHTLEHRIAKVLKICLALFKCQHEPGFIMTDGQFVNADWVIALVKRERRRSGPNPVMTEVEYEAYRQELIQRVLDGNIIY